MSNEHWSGIRVGDTVRILRARNFYGQDVSKFSPKPYQIGETFVVGRVDEVGQGHTYPCPIVFPEGEALDFWRADDLKALRSSFPQKEEVEFEGVAKRKLDDLLARGWEISGYSLWKDGDHGLITKGGFVGWFSVAERNAALQPTVPNAEEEIERLQKEQAALLDLIADLRRRHPLRWKFDMVDSATARAEAAERENKVLREALEPFADVADLIDAETEGLEEGDECQLMFHDYLMANYTVAHFRAARAALVQP